MTDGLEPFIGEIRPYPYLRSGTPYVPRGWAQCDGQLLQISQNTALFSLLGTNYGGDGQTTFALPDLRGRVPIHYGQGPGLSQRDLGAAGGAETVALSAAEMPLHSHAVAASGTFDTKDPGADVAAPGGSYGSTPDTSMHESTIQAAGGGQPHGNMPPYLTFNWCIAVQGIFPPRPSPA